LLAFGQNENQEVASCRRRNLVSSKEFFKGMQGK
jgi:hypothetical protein